MTVQSPPATRHTDLVASPPIASHSLTRRAALRGIGAAGLAAAGVALAGRIGPAAFATHDPKADPSAVITAYTAAVNSGNLDAILSCYTDDAIHVALPTSDGSAGVCQGKRQIRMFYEQAIANGDTIELVPESLSVDGERVAFQVRTTSAPWTALGLGPLEADSEAIVLDGCIVTHVVMLTPGAIRQLLVAQGIAADAGEHEHGRVRPQTSGVTQNARSISMIESKEPPGGIPAGGTSPPVRVPYEDSEHAVAQNRFATTGQAPLAASPHEQAF